MADIATIVINLDKSHLVDAVKSLSPVLSDIIAAQVKRAAAHLDIEARDQRTEGMAWVRSLRMQLSCVETALRGRKMCTSPEYRQHMIEVAALAITAIEAYDREAKRLVGGRQMGD